MGGRLKSHASGRRSGDQFCIYICDRFVVPTLTGEELAALAAGDRSPESAYTGHHSHEPYVPSCAYGRRFSLEARELESYVRRYDLPNVGRRIISP